MASCVSLSRRNKDSYFLKLIKKKKKTGRDVELCVVHGKNRGVPRTALWQGQCRWGARARLPTIQVGGGEDAGTCDLMQLRAVQTQ